MIASRRPTAAAMRLRLGVMLLAGAAIMLMGTWVVLFARLLEADRTIATRVREDAMWAVFQSDRNTAGLLHAVREVLVRGTPDRHEDVTVAYDVLYSRAMLLERGAFAIDLSGRTELGRQSTAHTAEIRALAPDFDALDPASPTYVDDLARLEPRIAALRDGMARLLLAANQEISLSRVAERKLREAIHDRLGWSAGLLVLAFLGIGTLLALQLRQLRRAHRRMELLQRRSLHQATKAKAASAAKSTFLATMSHEIRTPLNAIIGSAELLVSAGLDPAQKQRVQTIQSAGQLLLDVINDILDFSKLDTRGLELQPEVVNLASVAKTIASTFADRAAERNIRLTIALARGRIRTDPGRLRQVIVNLVGNALKFTPSGEVRLEGSILGAGRLRIRVIDTGIGIRPDDQARLFRDFEQVDGSYARAHGGSGLGLAICKRIVQGMGGDIGVVSTPGAGSIFWFEIPVEVLGDVANAEDVIALPPPGAPTSQGAFKVLIVEDNPINRAVLSDQLVQLGHHPQTAETGFAALDRLASERFDLVLMDMQMPGISGPDTTRRLRAAGCDLPVLGVTANASVEDRKSCEQAGMNGFLAKPVTLARLAEAMAEVLLGSASTGCAAPAPSAPNPQLEDLAKALGGARVQGLLTDFETSLPDMEDELRAALATQDHDRLDAALHTFKGAALTLGLAEAGAEAQALRIPAAVTSETVASLLRLARQDIERARSMLEMLQDRAA